MFKTWTHSGSGIAVFSVLITALGCGGSSKPPASQDGMSSYTITASAGPNGVIRPSGAVHVDAGSDQIFLITPNSGFRVGEVIVDGVSKGPSNTYSFHGVQAAHTIVVSFVSSDYNTLVLADRPVGYWPLAPDDPADKSGNGMTGVFAGSPLETSMPDKSVVTVFDGATQYFTVPDNDHLEITTTGILTIEAWIRPDTLQFPHDEDTGYVHWMGKGADYGTDGNQSFVGRMYNLTNTENRPNRISGYAFNPQGGLGAGSYFQDTVTVGHWIHYALTINTKDVSSGHPLGYTKVFKNGELRDQDSLSDYDVVPVNGNAPFRVGTENMDSFFLGAVGKVAIYDYELSPTQLLTHYQAMGAPEP